MFSYEASKFRKNLKYKGRPGILEETKVKNIFFFYLLFFLFFVFVFFSFEQIFVKLDFLELVSF